MTNFLPEFNARQSTTLRVLVDYVEAKLSYSRVKQLVFADVLVR